MSRAPRGRRLLMIEQGGRGGVADYTGALVARARGRAAGRSTLATADDHLYPADRRRRRCIRLPLRARRHAAGARACARAGSVRSVNGAALPARAAAPDAAWPAQRGHRAHAGLGDPADRAARARAACGSPGAPSCRRCTASSSASAHAAAHAPADHARLSGRLTARTIVHTQADLALLPDRRSRATPW